jgi:hypothetical protein
MHDVDGFVVGKMAAIAGRALRQVRDQLNPMTVICGKLYDDNNFFS